MRFGIQSEELLLRSQFRMDFYQNLACMYSKLFSVDGTIFGATFNQFYKSWINFKTEKRQKMLELWHWKIYHTCCFHGDISLTKNSTWYQIRCRQYQILSGFTRCNSFSCIFNIFWANSILLNLSIKSHDFSMRQLMTTALQGLRARSVVTRN